MTDRATTAMATIAGVVAGASVVAPVPFLRLFGVPAREVTGATRFALQLFAARNAYVAVNTLRGDPAAAAAFLPIQAMDQVAFWHAFATRSVPRPGAVLAASVSGVIVAIDLRRRRALRPSAGRAAAR